MRSLFGIIAITIALSGCTPTIDFSRAAYWQRADIRESIYLNGSRAQTKLNKDIAYCVTAIKSIQTPNKLRRALPADSDPYEPIVQRNLRSWDSPERDRYLFAEHTEFHNFEGCMRYLGWTRIMNIPAEDIQRAQKTYLKHQDIDPERHPNYARKKKSSASKKPKSNSSHKSLDLNE